MKWVVLIWSGVMRRPMRTTLTAVSIVFAFTLLGLLEGINQGTAREFEAVRADRLQVLNRLSPSSSIQLSYDRVIKRIPGVIDAIPSTYFGGYYQTRDNSLGIIATQPIDWFKAYPDARMVAGRVEDMDPIYTGIIISKSIADEFGWKVGDRIPIGSSVWQKKDGSYMWRFEIVGIYDVSPFGQAPRNMALINYWYFNEERPFLRYSTHSFLVTVDKRADAQKIANAIDEGLDLITKTFPEQILAQNQLRELADVSFIVNSAAITVMLIVLLLVGNVTMQSVSERLPEFAVLRAIGFEDFVVWALILAETLLLCVGSALLGLVITWFIFPLMQPVTGPLRMPVEAFLVSIVVACTLAVLSALAPALSAQRASIASALARL